MFLFLTEPGLHRDVVILLGQAFKFVHAAHVNAASAHGGEEVALEFWFVKQQQSDWVGLYQGAKGQSRPSGVHVTKKNTTT